MIEREVENMTESTEEKIGEATGGIAGALIGAGIGSAAGPVGTILGGIAGAAGGWWVGEEAGRAVDDWNDDDEDAARSFYDARDDNDVDYDAARAGYMSGYVAANNPDYESFDLAERDFRANWVGDWHSYDTMKPYLHAGFQRRRGY